jgi:hypothetical protein
MKSQKIGVFAGEIPEDVPFSYTYFKDRAQTQLVSVSPSAVNSIEINNLSEIITYPNPAYDELNIRFDSKISAKADFIIYNAIGQVLYKKPQIFTDKIILNQHTNFCSRNLLTEVIN